MGKKALEEVVVTEIYPAKAKPDVNVMLLCRQIEAVGAQLLNVILLSCTVTAYCLEIRPKLIGYLILTLTVLQLVYAICMERRLVRFRKENFPD